MSTFIVLDIVFYGSSLNYDQGVGNYQELKKITKWDGKQYTLVSRYALRYSILETGKQLGLWKLSDGLCLERAGEGEKTVIQPSEDLLLSGDILLYPEFDLFGYLVTTTTPQNSREAPVKISHAVSLTPFEFDTHLAGNLGLAKKMVEQTGKMDINLFTLEEHQTYYVYTVIIDVERIGKNEVYYLKEDGSNKKQKKEEKINKSMQEEKIENEKEEKIKKFMEEKKIENEKEENGFLLENKVDIIIPEAEKHELYKIEQTVKIKDRNKNITKDITEDRIKKLLKAIINLKRNIKGRSEDLSPKLLIVGFYKDHPYASYKDRIVLTNEYEEIFEEYEEPKNEGVRIVRRINKLTHPKFLIKGQIKGLVRKNENPIGIVEEKEIEEFLFPNSSNSRSKNEVSSEVRIFKSPEIEVEVEELKKQQ